MWDDLYPFFLWTENTWLGHAIRQSKWTFSLTEVGHLLSLTVLLGTVLIVGLRLFGLVLCNKTVAEVAHVFASWSISALAVVVLSGLLLFVSEATKCWGNVAFRYKMLFLFLALTFQFTVLRIICHSEEDRFPLFARKMAALVAVILWFAVGVAGRAIAFF